MPHNRIAPYISGFENCVQYGSSVCGCSYSCKFVREYYEDSKELSESERKLLNSSWAAKRKISAEKRDKRKAEEAEAQAAMWERIQIEMAKEQEQESVTQEEESIKLGENKDSGEVEIKQLEVEAN